MAGGHGVPPSLFPAHAGVILPHRARFRKGMPIPRPRGGDPSAKTVAESIFNYSPPTRG